MTKVEAVKEFREIFSNILIRWKGKDQPMIDQAWNDWADSLYKDGRITLKQYTTWGHPF